MYDNRTHNLFRLQSHACASEKRLASKKKNVVNFKSPFLENISKYLIYNIIISSVI